jgi:predicted secreted protein
MAYRRGPSRTFLLVIAVLCIASRVAAPQSAPTTERVMPTESSSRALNITLAVGSSYTLELPGHGSAGYVWEMSLAGDAASVEVSHATGAAPPPPPPGGPPPSSYSVTDSFVVSARAPGTAIVRLERRRPWEKTAPARETVILTVVVAAT